MRSKLFQMEWRFWFMLVQEYRYFCSATLDVGNPIILDHIGSRNWNYQLYCCPCLVISLPGKLINIILNSLITFLTLFLCQRTIDSLKRDVWQPSFFKNTGNTHRGWFNDASPSSLVNRDPRYRKIILRIGASSCYIVTTNLSFCSIIPICLSPLEFPNCRIRP